MESLIKIKNEYNSLDKLQSFLNTSSGYECAKSYDSWEVRTDANGNMEQCLVVKKNAMHAVKVFFANENTVKVNYIIPNKMMHAYFGKSEKAYKNILEITGGLIKNAVLKGSQNKAFHELEQIVIKAS